MENIWQTRRRSATKVALGVSAVAFGAGAQQAHAAAITIDFNINTLSYTNTANTTGATNDVGTLPAGVSTYTTVAGPDQFYQLIVLNGGDLTVTATPAAGYDIAIYLTPNFVTVNPGGLASSAIMGSDVGGAGAVESFTVLGLAPGTYLISIDSFYSTGSISAGSYQLNVTGSNGLTVGSAGVPEPGTMSLVGAGLVGMAAWRRRRKGQA